MTLRALSLLCCAALSGCVHTVVSVEEQRPYRPTEEIVPTTAPRVWTASIAATDGGARLKVVSSRPCKKRLVATVKRSLVTQREGNKVATPQPDAREVLREWVEPCERRVAARATLVVQGPSGTDAVTIQTDDDGVALVPFDARAVGRVTVGAGDEVTKELDQPR